MRCCPNVALSGPLPSPELARSALRSVISARPEPRYLLQEDRATREARRVCCCMAELHAFGAAYCIISHSDPARYGQVISTALHARCFGWVVFMRTRHATVSIGRAVRARRYVQILGGQNIIMSIRQTGGDAS